MHGLFANHYSGSFTYGHPSNTDFSLLWTFPSVPKEFSLIFFKKQPSIKYRPSLIQTTDTKSQLQRVWCKLKLFITDTPVIQCWHVVLSKSLWLRVTSTSYSLIVNWSLWWKYITCSLMEERENVYERTTQESCPEELYTAWLLYFKAWMIIYRT